MPIVNAVAELNALQGQWKVVNVEKEKDAGFSIAGSRGRILSVAAINCLEIGPSVVEFVSYEEGKAVTCSYRIDPMARPKTVDLYRLNQLTAIGIYEIEGDQLKICLVNYLESLKTEQRPKDFTIEPGANKVVFTLQRYQLSAAEKAMQGEWNLVEQVKKARQLQARDRKMLFLYRFQDTIATINLMVMLQFQDAMFSIRIRNRKQ